MKKLLLPLSIALCLIAGFVSSAAASPAMEKAFIDTYKKAFETKDEAGLTGLLYTKGADPMALEFYTMMLTGDMGGKITKIELRDLTPEEQKKATGVMPGPSGDTKLVLNATKKLVLEIQSSSENGSGTSKSESFVAEHAGKYVIPVPGPVK